MRTKLGQLNRRIENLRWLDWIALALCMALVTIVSIYHEPWRDEAQAWLLARDMNLLDLIFKELRYEGHTPLWYIILALPAKLGVPYEIGLKSVSLTITAAAMVLLIRKSPFPWYMRYSLPFSYFLFYQFTVINRSYCLIVLLMWILAMLFHRRHEKPLRFGAVLILLGSVSAHGILIGGGIALAWLIEIMVEQIKANGRRWFGSLLRDRRSLVLLLYAASLILFAIILWPPPDRYTYGLVLDYGGMRFVYSILLAPLDGLVTDVAVHFALGSPWYSGLLPAILCVLSLLVFFYCMWKKGLLKYALLSYLPLTLFFGLVYFTLYHQGLYVVWMVSLIWIAMTGPTRRILLMERVPHKARRASRLIVPLSLAAVMITQLVYTSAISYNEITLTFESGRDTANYIKEHGIEGRSIMNEYDFNKEFGNVYTDQVVSALPYFDHNIFYNFNGGNPGMSYNPFRFPTGKEPEQWKKQGEPEFFLDNFFHSINDYKNIINPDDYVQIASFDYYHLWKLMKVKYTDRLYARRDIAPAYLPAGK